MPANVELLERLLAPIPGDAPAGRDLRYDPRYDAVKEARREDMDLPSGELDGPRKLADWPQVVSLATGLLEKETKDLQLAAWLTEALLKREGMPGLATGLAVLEGLLANYWETVFPLVEDDDIEIRTGPLEWVGSRLGLPVRQSPLVPGVTILEYLESRGIPTEEETKGNKDKEHAREEAVSSGKRMPEAIDSAIEGAPKAVFRTLIQEIDATIAAVASLESACDTRFGSDAPGFSQLRVALTEVRMASGGILARKLELDPDPVDESGATDGDDGAPEVAGDGTIASEPTSVRDAASRIAAGARYLRQQEPTNPAPYLLLRGYRWGELRATAGEVDPRLLEAPPTALRARLKGLLLDARWQELLEQGEGLMALPQGRGWLDLQRYTLTACANLGEAYDGVAAVVRSELRALLAALPQLPHMTLMDDTPTANGETREWLTSEGLVGDAADSGTESAPAEGRADDDGTEDTPADDGTEALETALDEEDATSSNGGFVKAPVRRARARPGAHADPFTSARHELTLGRPNRAIELMVAQHARERSPRGRFVRQTQVAYLMVEAGLEAVARPMLERLVQIIDERSLEDWESGPLVAQPLALLCQVYDKLEVREDDREELYLRVCRLDPLQALGLRRG